MPSPVARLPKTANFGVIDFDGLMRRRNQMAWTTPTVIEVCCGMEITRYLPADGGEPILF